MASRYIGMPVDEFVDRHIFTMEPKKRIIYCYRDPEKFACADHEVRYLKDGWLMFDSIGSCVGSTYNIGEQMKGKRCRSSVISIIRREFEGVRGTWDRMIYLDTCK